MVVHFQERDQYFTACGLDQYSWSRFTRYSALCNWEKVTCKNCLKKVGRCFSLNTKGGFC